MHENEMGQQVVDAAVQIHRELGPGLLETVYEVVLARELEQRGFRVERQVPVPIVYRGLRFEEGFRADIIVEGKVILELNSVEQLNKVHAKQVFTYLKLKGLRLGFLLNFGGNLMKDGIERIVNGVNCFSISATIRRCSRLGARGMRILLRFAWVSFGCALPVT
jgi:GxxExxY protein